MVQLEVRVALRYCKRWIILNRRQFWKCSISIRRKPCLLLEDQIPSQFSETEKQQRHFCFTITIAMKFDKSTVINDCADLPSKGGLRKFKLFPIDEQQNQVLVSNASLLVVSHLTMFALVQEYLFDQAYYATEN